MTPNASQILIVTLTNKSHLTLFNVGLLLLFKGPVFYPFSHLYFFVTGFIVAASDG